MNISYPHGTTKAEALERVKAYNTQLMERFASEVAEVKQEWREDGFTASIKVYGITINGRLAVKDATIEMEVDLPWLARSREGQIRERTVKALQEIFVHGKEQIT